MSQLEEQSLSESCPGLGHWSEACPRSLAACPCQPSLGHFPHGLGHLQVETTCSVACILPSLLQSSTLSWLC